MHVLLGIVALEVEELSDDQVGDVGIDGSAKENDPLAEELRIDVEGSLAAGGLSMTVGINMGRPSFATVQLRWNLAHLQPQSCVSKPLAGNH